MPAVQSVIEDILSAQDVQGSNLLYQQHEGELIAVELDEEGDEVSRYIVKVSLEKI